MQQKSEIKQPDFSQIAVMILKMAAFQIAEDKAKKENSK
jgi:hypothetical protein